MGFFDVLNPLFAFVDRGLETLLPEPVRLVLWAFAGALATMLLYRALSRQEQMGAIKQELRRTQQQLANYDGEFADLKPLIARTLGLSMRQLGLALWPALIASLPLVFLLAWAATRFDTTPPGPGQAVDVTVEPASAPVHWTPASAAVEQAPGHWEIRWPDSARITLRDAENNPILVIPTPRSSPVVHKKQWWNALFANPAGYLDPDSPVDAVHVALPQASYLPFGPGWFRSWLTAFLLAVFVFSFGIKIYLKIH